jgi:hypothetical protein
MLLSETTREHIPVHVIKAILNLGIRLVRPGLDRPKHGHFLFWFLPIGGEQQDGVMIRFDKKGEGEGLVCIAEVRVATRNKCSLRIYGFQFA